MDSLNRQVAAVEQFCKSRATLPACMSQTKQSNYVSAEAFHLYNYACADSEGASFFGDLQRPALNQPKGLAVMCLGGSVVQSVWERPEHSQRHQLPQATPVHEHVCQSPQSRHKRHNLQGYPGNIEVYKILGREAPRTVAGQQQPAVTRLVRGVRWQGINGLLAQCSIAQGLHQSRHHDSCLRHSKTARPCQGALKVCRAAAEHLL